MLWCGCGVHYKLVPGSRAATLLLVWVGARLHHLNCTCPACNNCAHRDQQGATAFERCIRDAARSLLQEKEAALQEAGHSRPQPRSRPESRCVPVNLQQQAPDFGNSR